MAVAKRSNNGLNCRTDIVWRDNTRSFVAVLYTSTQPAISFSHASAPDIPIPPDTGDNDPSAVQAAFEVSQPRCSLCQFTRMGEF
jgi:hypothetical protein